MMTAWWFIPLSKWTNPTYPIYNQGYNPLTIRGMNHQVGVALFRETSSKQVEQLHDNTGKTPCPI